MPNGEPEDQDQAEAKDVHFSDFEIYAESNPGFDNSDLYEHFPSKPKGTLRRWKMEYLNSKEEQKPEQKPQKEKSNETLIKNNRTLMRNTPYDDDFFEGMPPSQVNTFLLNYHRKREEEKGGDREPNTPIIGTPVGNANNPIDDFLAIDSRLRKIEFEAPASKVFSKEKSKKEAEKQWVRL